MTTNENLKDQVAARLHQIRENTIIVDQIESFHLTDIKGGIVIVWASCSGPVIQKINTFRG